MRRFNVTVEALQEKGQYGSVRALALRHKVDPKTLWRWVKKARKVAPLAVRDDESRAENATDGV